MERHLAGFTLTIGDSTVSGSTGGLLIASTTSQAVTISATSGSLQFANEGIVYVGTTTTALATTISAPITGSGAVAVDPFTAAASQLTLSASSNSYTGTTTLASAGSAGNGVLSIANGNDLGSGTLVLDNGTLSTAAASTLSNAVTINGTPTLGGTAALTFAGAVTLTSNSTLTQSNSGGVTFGSAGITDGTNGYSLSIAGAGTTTYSGAIGGTPGSLESGPGQARAQPRYPVRIPIPAMPRSTPARCCWSTAISPTAPSPRSTPAAPWKAVVWSVPSS